MTREIEYEFKKIVESPREISRTKVVNFQPYIDRVPKYLYDRRLETGRWIACDCTVLALDMAEFATPEKANEDIKRLVTDLNRTLNDVFDNYKWDEEEEANDLILNS